MRLVCCVAKQQKRRITDRVGGLHNDLALREVPRQRAVHRVTNVGLGHDTTPPGAHAAHLLQLCQLLCFRASGLRVAVVVVAVAVAVVAAAAGEAARSVRGVCVEGLSVWKGGVVHTAPVLTLTMTDKLSPSSAHDHTDWASCLLTLWLVRNGQECKTNRNSHPLGGGFECVWEVQSVEAVR
jgi:hypothetical protein